jgi:hypothetical protein
MLELPGVTVFDYSASRVANSEGGKEVHTHRLDMEQQVLAGPHIDRVLLLLTSSGKFPLHGLPRTDFDLGGCDIGWASNPITRAAWAKRSALSGVVMIVTFFSFSWILAARTIIPPPGQAAQVFLAGYNPIDYRPWRGWEFRRRWEIVFRASPPGRR